MIVQHTDKECKTKFSIGVEFKNSLYILKKINKKTLTSKKVDVIINFALRKEKQ